MKCLSQNGNDINNNNNNNNLVPKIRLVLINKNKKTCHLMDFAIPIFQRVKIKEKDRQILGPCQRTEKVVEHLGVGDTNCS